MRPNMSRVFIAGFVGTVCITLMMYFVSPLMSGGPVDIAAMLSGAVGGSWVAGIIAHFVIGTLILPAIYGYFLFRIFTGGPAVRGMTWGLVLWFISQMAIMPVLGAGFFSAQAGGARAALDSLLGHLAYGLILGVGGGGARRRQSERTEGLGSEVHVRRAG
jgi:hypothetical protein